MITQMTVITKTVTGAVDRTTDFNLSTSEYIIRGIDGLGPVANDLASTKISFESFDSYLGARATPRNVLVRMGFAPNYGNGGSASTLRRSLYTYFTPGMPITMQFTDTVLGVYEIDGVVETHEPSIFTREPEVTISIMCYDPYFSKVGEVETVISIPEFPGGPSVNYSYDFVYPGNVPVPLRLEGNLNGNRQLVFGITVSSGRGAGTIGLNGGTAPSGTNGDLIAASSVKGSRYFRWTQGVTVKSLAGYMMGSLSDLRVGPGTNRVTIQGGTSGAITNVKLYYRRRYEGM